MFSNIDAAIAAMNARPVLHSCFSLCSTIHTDTALQHFCSCLFVTINHLIRQSLLSTTTGRWC